MHNQQTLRICVFSLYTVKGETMMYGNKIAAAIKVNGQVLREFKDTVYVPFGAEYTILLKNLHTTRAVVNVYIDGDNVVPGGLVLDAGREVELERAIKNNNLTEGNRFKFIERTGNIEEYRGVKLEDGLIRIEHQFEQPRPVINVTDQYWKQYPPGVRTPTWNPTLYGGVTGISGSTGDRFSVTASGATCQVNVNGIMRGIDYSKGESVKASAAAAINQVSPQSAELHDGMATMDWCDTGITVPGSKSTQTFQHTTVGLLEAEKHSMVIRILGDLGHNKPVTKPVTVKHKVKCTTCGRQNKHNAKFCTECGTALEIFA